MSLIILESANDVLAFNDNITLSDDVVDLIAELATDDVNEKYDKLVKAEDAFDRYEQAINDINNLGNIITEEGISKGMMKSIDPEEVLITNLNLPFTYDDLNSIPTHDEKAKYVQEGIADTIKKWWKKFVEFMKMIWEKIKSFFSSITNRFKKSEKVLTALFKKYKDGEFDDEKADKVEVTYDKPKDKVEKNVLDSAELDKI